MTIYGYDEIADEIDINEATRAWLPNHVVEPFSQAILIGDRLAAISLIENFAKECSAHSIEKYVDALLGKIGQADHPYPDDDGPDHDTMDQVRLGNLNYAALLLVIEDYSVRQARALVEELVNELASGPMDLVEIEKSEAKDGGKYVARFRDIVFMSWLATDPRVGPFLMDGHTRRMLADIDQLWVAKPRVQPNDVRK